MRRAQSSYWIESVRIQNIERTRTSDAAQKEKTRGRAVRTFGGSGAIPPASQMLTQGLYQNVEMVRTENIHNRVMHKCARMIAQIRNFSFALALVVARCVGGSDQVLIGTSTTSQLPRTTEKAAV